MEAAPTISHANALERLPRFEWSAVSTWLLGFGLVAYLGLNGGGYDPLVHDQVGIAVWWIFLATTAVGAVPRRRLGMPAWCALGLLTAFVAWTALSLDWTESAEKTAADLARVSAYLGIFALALFARGSKSIRRMGAAVGAGVAFVAIVALLSRLHPAWFSEARQTGDFISGGHERLSYPLDYWNGLAALIAVGFPLMVQAASSGRSIYLRGLAAAVLPAMGLTIFFTLSRGGIAAAVVGLAVYLALSWDRLPRLSTMLVAGAGGAILIAAATQRDALQHGLLNAAARDQGNEMLAMTIVVCAGVGLIQMGISLGLLHDLRPRWAFVSRRQSLVLALSGVFAALVVAIAIGAPGRISDAVADFERGGTPGRGTERLANASGQNRYQLWSSAVRENQAKPLTGTGSGTFEYWWSRDRDVPTVVLDTHSLYLQTLGELGIIGLALLVAFLSTILFVGTRTAIHAGGEGRARLAAALAGCVAFCAAAAFDWTWQIPVVPVAFLLLAAVVVGAGGKRVATAGLPLPLRGICVVAALAAIWTISAPLASSALVRESQQEARDANYAGALDAARRAQDVAPRAAAPRMQQALILEVQGKLAGASAAAGSATEAEPTNWETWLVRSRIEAKRGRAPAALRYYRKAKSLNPLSPLFAR